MSANRSNYLPLPGNALPYYMVTQTQSDNTSDQIKCTCMRMSQLGKNE